MDINRFRFPTDLLDIIEYISQSHFIAFDLEFTGVAERRLRDGGKKLTLQEVYDDVREAAKRYQILQVGLTIVQEDRDKGELIMILQNWKLEFMFIRAARVHESTDIHFDRMLYCSTL